MPRFGRSARFSFASTTDERARLDATRLMTRLIRNIDFAVRDEDGAILIVFTQTDLRSTHVIARRIAGMLRNNILTPPGAECPRYTGNVEDWRQARHPDAARGRRPDGCGGIALGLGWLR